MVYSLRIKCLRDWHKKLFYHAGRRSTEWIASAIEIFNVKCYLIARHYPCRYNSFSKQHYLCESMTGFGKVFLRRRVFTPEECHVNRIAIRLISALQRSAMSVDGDEPNACVSAERNVECYLRDRVPMPPPPTKSGRGLSARLPKPLKSGAHASTPLHPQTLST